MAYSYSISLALGSSKVGLSLTAQLVNTSGTNVGAAITTGFIEIGAGNYLWTYISFPDGFRGGIKFYQTGIPATTLAFTSFNPEDAQYIDTINTEVVSPEEIEIDVSHSQDQFTIIPGVRTP